jgi:hypothetical protein
MIAASRLSTEQRRALAMLAAAGRDGLTQPLLVAHGFCASMLVDRVNQGLATLTSSKIRVDGKMIEVGRVRIKAAGRRAIEEGGWRRDDRGSPD